MMRKFGSPTITSNFTACFLAAYFTAVFNFPFFSQLWRAANSGGRTDFAILFTVPLVLFSLLMILFLIFLIPYVGKWIIGLLIITSSIVFYTENSYHIPFGVDMVENTFQTDFAEASSYLSLNFILTFFATGLIPLLALLYCKINYKGFIKRLVIIFALLVFITTNLFLFNKNYVSVWRNNSDLRKYAVPLHYLWSTYTYIKKNYYDKKPFYQRLGMDAHHQQTTSLPNLFVVVIGETSRAKNNQYNGYTRNTNPYTSKYDLISFKKMTSCGTATAVSLPCLFSFMNRENYNGVNAKNQDNVLDVIQRAGYQVVWLDNDSGCKKVCARVPTIETSMKQNPNLCKGRACYDEALLPLLQQALINAKGKDTLIVLHLIGSHGPDYYQRYPKKYERFSPTCLRKDIQNCEDNALRNTYDNTLVYTDFILSETIKQLKNYNNNYNTGLFYLSDHGESLGEKGLYLHGMPYRFAPEEQTHISSFLWLSSSTKKELGLNWRCLEEIANKKPLSQDFFSHSLLHLTNVSSKIFNDKLDLFNECTQPK